MSHKHFTNITLNSTTHNQNPIYLKKFLHRLPWLPTVTSQISLPLFLSLKPTNPSLSLSKTIIPSPQVLTNP